MRFEFKEYLATKKNRLLYRYRFQNSTSIEEMFVLGSKFDKYYFKQINLILKAILFESSFCLF